MYERRGEKPITAKEFRWRMVWHVVSALILLLLSILFGALGFVAFEGVPWITAGLHSTMLLSGLGLAELPQAAATKLFASLFALYSGFVFVAVSGIIAAPIAHRILHLFHWDAGRGE